MTLAVLVLLLMALAASAGNAAEPTSAVFLPFVAGGQSRDNCDPSYPTICLPSPPPDLNCPQIPYNDFVVLPPDPHRLDADKDGIGCESPALYSVRVHIHDSDHFRAHR